MSDTTNISWTDHTGGPWMVCSEVSPGCVNCYARELLLNRLQPMIRRAYEKAGFADWETRPVWGEKATRVVTKGFWKDVYRLNRQAAHDGVRRKWFPSLIDILDSMPAGIIDQDGNHLTPREVLASFLDVVRTCTNLDFLLLTKRPENFPERVEAAQDWHFDNGDRNTAGWLSDWRKHGIEPANVWFGTTVEDQPRTSRIADLRRIPATRRFLSVEPQLERIKLPTLDGIDWVICGGESGPGARPFHVEWARDLRDQCKAAGCKFFMKQLGSNPVQTHVLPGYDFGTHTHGPLRKEDRAYPGITHPKGADPSEWPADLRVQEWPEGRAA